MNLQITLRSEKADDEAFLLDLYSGTRREEVAMFGWDASQQEVFLRMQFEMQTQAYSIQFPSAVRSVILVYGKSAGRMIVNRSDDSVSLIDIIVSPAFRRKGIAIHLIRQLQNEAAKNAKPVKLSVSKGNISAIRLYEQLGFLPCGEGDFDIKMLWRPSPK